MRVNNGSVIVTGADGGIGEGIAMRLAAEVGSDEAAFISGVCINVDGARCV